MTSSYVEVLRVTRALRIVAVVLGVLLLCALILRFSWGAPSRGTPAARDYYADLERSRTAHVTRTRLHNGIVRTVIDDPTNEVYAIVERRGSTVVSVVSAHTKEAAAAQMRARKSTTTVTTGSTEIVLHPRTELGMLFAAALPIGLFAATLLGGPLSKENNGHLEAAWTKPVSRVRYALGAMMVDVAGVVIAHVAAAIVIFVCMSFWSVPNVSFEADNAALFVGYMLGVAIAWYAFLTALSASFKRGPGIIIGVGWALALIVPWLAGSTGGATTSLGRSVHALFEAGSYLIPVGFAMNNFSGIHPVHEAEIGLAAMAALTAVYVAAAVLQWRRVEA